MTAPAAGSLRLLRQPHVFGPRTADAVVPPGGTLAELLRAAGLRPSGQESVLVNEVAVPRERWETFRPAPGSLIRVCVVPQGGGDGAKVLRTVAMIVVAAVAMWAGGFVAGTFKDGVLVSGLGLGTFGGGLAAGGVMVLGSLLVNAAFPLPTPDFGRDFNRTSDARSITGTSNRPNPYGKVPCSFGVTREYPYWGALPYSLIEGEEEVVHLCFDLGPGPKKLRDWRLGENPIENFPNIELEVREGYPDDAPLTLYPGRVHTQDLSVTLTYDEPERDFPPANVDVERDAIRIRNHPFADGSPVEVRSTGTPPPPLQARTGYRVVSRTADSVQLADGQGHLVNLTGPGSGTHTLVFGRSFEPEDVDLATNRLTLPGHFWAAGARVETRSTGAPPAPLVAGTTYFVVDPDGDSLALAAVAGGAALDLTDAGTGRHTLAPSTEHVFETNDDCDEFVVEVAFQGLGRVDPTSGEVSDNVVDVELGYRRAGTADPLTREGLRVPAGTRVESSAVTLLSTTTATEQLTDEAGNPTYSMVREVRVYRTDERVTGTKLVFEAEVDDAFYDVSPGGDGPGGDGLGGAGDAGDGGGGEGATCKVVPDALITATENPVVPAGVYPYATLEIETRAVGATRWVRAKQLRARWRDLVTRSGVWEVLSNTGIVPPKRGQQAELRFTLYAWPGSTLTVDSWVYETDGSAEGTQFVRFTDRRQTLLRKGIHVVTPARDRYEVHVRRLTPDATSYYDLSVSTLTALKTLTNESPFGEGVLGRHCVAAMRFQASEGLQGVLDQINVVSSRVLPVWTGPGEDDWEERETSSPAWAYADVFRGPAARTRLAASRLQLERLRAFAFDCRAKGLEFNGVFDFKTTRYQAAATILSAVKASFGMSDGRYDVVWDYPQAVPVDHLTPRTTWGFEETKSFLDLPHALRCRFQNREKGWAEDEVVVYDDGYDATNATRFESADLFGTTSAAQAWILGRRELAGRKLRPELYTLSLGVEHLRVTRGDLVTLTHDVLCVGQTSGRVKTVVLEAEPPDPGAPRALGVTVDEPVTMEEGKRYYLRVRLADFSPVVAEVVGVAGTWDTLAFTETRTESLGEGDLWSFGELDAESIPCLVHKIEPGPDLTAKLTLVDAAPGIHAADVLPRDFTPADVDPEADTLTLGEGHPFADDDDVSVGSTDTPPAPLVPRRRYWIVGRTPTAVQLAETKGGAPVDLTDAGLGTHTLTRRIPAFESKVTLPPARNRPAPDAPLVGEPQTQLGLAPDGHTVATVLLPLTPRPKLGVTVAGYQGQVRRTGGEAWTTVAGLPAEAVEYRFTGLEPGGAYEFRVRAVAANGLASPWATATAVLGADLDPPSAPTNLRTSFDHRLYVLWDPPPERDLSHYLASADGWETSYRATKPSAEVLNPDARSFTFRVKAVDRTGNESEEASLPVELAPPAAPEAANLKYRGDWHALGLWLDDAQERSLAHVGFAFQWSPDAGANWHDVAQGTADTGTLIVPWSTWAGPTLDVLLRAAERDFVGLGPWSGTVGVTLARPTADQIEETEDRRWLGDGAVLPGDLGSSLNTRLSGFDASLAALRSDVDDLTTTPWDAVTQFAPDDLLTYGGAVYKVKSPAPTPPNPAPPNATYYELVGDYSSLSAQVAAQATAISDLDARTDATEATNAAQATQITGLTTRMTTAEGVNTAQASSLTSLGSRVTQTESTLTSQAQQLTGLDARIGSAEGVNTAQASSLSSLGARVTSTEQGLSAQATQLSGVSTTVGGHTTTLSQQAQSLDGLKAQYAVKLDADGFLAGFGLASEPVDGQPFSEFLASADRFAILNPNTARKVVTAITRANGVATATCANHGFAAGAFVVLGGWDQGAYNGTKQVLAAPNANQFTFAVAGTPATPGTARPGYTPKVGAAVTPFVVEDGVVYMNSALIRALVAEELRTGTSGARVEITKGPSAAATCYDGAGTQVFQVLLSGPDAGDVIVGDPAGEGVRFDASAKKLSFAGVDLVGTAQLQTNAGAQIGADWQEASLELTQNWRDLAATPPVPVAADDKVVLFSDAQIAYAYDTEGAIISENEAFRLVRVRQSTGTQSTVMTRTQLGNRPTVSGKIDENLAPDAYVWKLQGMIQWNANVQTSVYQRAITAFVQKKQE